MRRADRGICWRHFRALPSDDDDDSRVDRRALSVSASSTATANVATRAWPLMSTSPCLRFAAALFIIL